MLVHSSFVPAQDISFFHLNTASGLSDNLVTSAARDKNGVLWIGTAEGLNSYDGFTVKKYYKEEFPALGGNHIADIFCDNEKNQIWLRSINGKITLVDEKRNFITVPVLDQGKEIAVSFICKTRSRGIIAIFKNKIYVLKKGNHYYFEPMDWNNEYVFIRANFQQQCENSDTLIFSANNRVCIFDVGRTKILYNIQVPAVIGAALLNNEELIATTENNQELLRINLSTHQAVKNYGILKDQYEEPIKGYLRQFRKINDGRYILASAYGGIYIFDAEKETIRRYQHDPLDKRSISANNTSYVYTESSGYVYIATRSAGLNYFNSDFQTASYRSAFKQTAGEKIFHGFVNCITRHRDGNFWLGTQTGLIEWDRNRDKTVFHEYGIKNGSPLSGTEEVKTICFDKNDNIWIGTNRFGIVILDKKSKVVRYMYAGSGGTADYLPGNYISNIVSAPDKKLWVATSHGLCIINPDTYTVEKKTAHNLLNQLKGVLINNIWFRNNDEVWIATSNGAYRYRISNGELDTFRTENEVTSNFVFCFTDDNYGNVYIGTSQGLIIVKGNKIVKIYTRNNGLRSDRCFGLLKDKAGHVWIGNDNALLSYNPFDSSFSLFDDSHGLSPSGFRQLSYYQSEGGEQFWGSDEGLSYFFPEQMKRLRIPVQVNINSFSAGHTLISFSAGEKITLPYSQNNLLFSFSAIDLFGSKNIVYEYTLEGIDEGWKRATTPQQVSYSNLPSGNYSFVVRASKDGINWANANNQFSVLIKTPWWKSGWFLLLCAGTAISSGYYLVRNRYKKIREQKEELETEQAINYFATSMTGQGSAEETLWDVAKNCIGHLGFEDCVIYLLDENKKVLIQKAAWGPKTTHENKILNPIEIRLGKGIVGTVATTGKAEIINDTSKDERYIVDDVRRWSEIAVPIISNNEVLGVIDSEHSRKNFFTKRQLSILTTIASLCANKIVRKKAEEEKQKAEKNLIETQRQTAEMEMQALRAQMNPHFMFNSLNSINNFILKNDPDNASQYLTRFSRLMRLILDNSREEWVLLENEIKALQLYIEMEAIRFDNVFEYKISTALDVNPSSVIVPPMIVQPYVENAIWHGLLHRKEPGSNLQIDIWKNNGELFIKVEDNGVGREEAEHLKSKFSSHKKSHGMKITAKRLDMVNKIYNVDAKVKIEDLKNGDGKAGGTSVLLHLKYKTSHND